MTATGLASPFPLCRPMVSRAVDSQLFCSAGILLAALPWTALLAPLCSPRCPPHVWLPSPSTPCSFPVFSVAPHPVSPSTSRWRSCIGKRRGQELYPFKVSLQTVLPEGPPKQSSQMATDSPFFLTQTLSLPHKESSLGPCSPHLKDFC